MKIIGVPLSPLPDVKSDNDPIRSVSLLGEEKVSLEEIVQYPLIFLEPNSNSRKYVEKFIRESSLSYYLLAKKGEYINNR